MMYPLAEFNETMKTHDWRSVQTIPSMAQESEEVKWVPPEKFVDTLPFALKDAPALPGDEARYAQVMAVLLPAPKTGDFSLYIRSYWPKAPITDGSWTPPAVRKVD